MRSRRGGIWLLVGLLLAVLAGGIAFVTIIRVTSATPVAQEERQPVVVAAQAVQAGTILSAEDIEVRDLPADAIPEGAVTSLDEALGKLTTQDLVPGEVLLVARLVDPSKQGASVAFTIEEGKVVLAIPPSDLMSSIGLLKAGDRVDLLFTMSVNPGGQGEQDTTFNALQNLRITAVVMPSDILQEKGSSKGDKSSKPQALLLALDPQDALVVKYLKDAGGIMDIALRAPTDTQTYDVEPVDLQYLLDRYQIRVLKSLPEK